MAWVTITVSDLRDAKASALVDAFATAALGDGQTDPIERTIADIVGEVRAEVATCQSNRLDLNPLKVPANLKALTERLILWRLRQRLAATNKTLAPTEQDRIDHADDLAKLRRVALCQSKVDASDDPQPLPTVQQAGGITLVSGCGPRVTGAGLSGL